MAGTTQRAPFGCTRALGRKVPKKSTGGRSLEVCLIGAVITLLPGALIAVTAARPNRPAH